MLRCFAALHGSTRAASRTNSDEADEEPKSQAQEDRQYARPPAWSSDCTTTARLRSTVPLVMLQICIHHGRGDCMGIRAAGVGDPPQPRRGSQEHLQRK